MNVGRYTAIVTASNTVGSQSTTTTVTINDVAIASLDAMNNGPTILGQPTVLSATITSGSDVTYHWDFGDGSQGSGSMPSYVYKNTGTFTAVVTASNTLSSQTATTNIQDSDLP